MALRHPNPPSTDHAEVLRVQLSDLIHDTARNDRESREHTPRHIRH
jgi:hypothetical protein